MRRTAKPSISFTELNQMISNYHLSHAEMKEIWFWLLDQVEAQENPAMGHLVESLVYLYDILLLEDRIVHWTELPALAIKVSVPQYWELSYVKKG